MGRAGDEMGGRKRVLKLVLVLATAFRRVYAGGVFGGIVQCKRSGNVGHGGDYAIRGEYDGGRARVRQSGAVAFAFISRAGAGYGRTESAVGLGEA